MCLTQAWLGQGRKEADIGSPCTTLTYACEQCEDDDDDDKNCARTSVASLSWQKETEEADWKKKTKGGREEEAHATSVTSDRRLRTSLLRWGTAGLCQRP